jgi:putative transposase
VVEISKIYPSDLSDARWEVLEPLLERRNPVGRKRGSDMRQIINAINYLLRTGCQWRLLPREYPRWDLVYYYYKQWRLDGTWRRVHDALRERVRHRAGKETSPSAAIIDSRSVKTVQKGGRVVTTPAKRSKGASGISR